MQLKFRMNCKNKNLWLFTSIKVLPRHCRISLVNLTYWQLMIYYKTTTNSEKMSEISLERMVFISLMIKQSAIITILQLIKCCILQVGFVATFIKGNEYWYRFNYLLHSMNYLNLRNPISLISSIHSKYSARRITPERKMNYIK